MRERRATLCLHGMQRGTRAAGVETFGEAGGECSPADLHEQSRDERRLHVLGDVCHLPTDGAAAVEAPGVLGALHTERNRTVTSGFTKTMYTRVARRVVAAARAMHHVGTEVAQTLHEHRIGVLRHEHFDRPTHGASERAGGESGIAATGDGERRTSIRPAGPWRQTETLCCDEVQQLGEEVTRFLRTRHVVRLVFHPHSTVLCEAECVRQLVGARKRREDEAGASDAGNLLVEFFDERVAVVFAHAVGVGEGIPCEIATKRDERVLVLGAAQRRDVALDEQHMVTIVAL